MWGLLSSEADNWGGSLDCLMSDTLSIWSPPGRAIGEYSSVLSVQQLRRITPQFLP